MNNPQLNTHTRMCSSWRYKDKPVACCLPCNIKDTYTHIPTCTHTEWQIQAPVSVLHKREMWLNAVSVVGRYGLAFASRVFGTATTKLKMQERYNGHQLQFTCRLLNRFFFFLKDSCNIYAQRRERNQTPSSSDGFVYYSLPLSGGWTRDSSGRYAHTETEQVSLLQSEAQRGGPPCPDRRYCSIRCG